MVEAADRWGLRDLTPVAGGRGGGLWSASSVGGPRVVKAPFPPNAPSVAAQEALAAAGGGVAVLESTDRLVLLPKLDARPLGATPSAHDRKAAARLLAGLRPVSAPQLPELAGWLRARLEQLPRDVSRHSRPPSGPQRRRVLRLLDELGGGPARFCHGDANSGNVLVGAAGGCVLVDARGVCGDVHFDLATLAVKTNRTAPAPVQDRDAAKLARTVGLDGQRAAAWAQVVRAARV